MRLSVVVALIASLIGCGLVDSEVPKKVAKKVKGELGDQKKKKGAEEGKKKKKEDVRTGTVTKIDFETAGTERYAYLHVPNGYDPATPTPMIVAFHGGKGSPTSAEGFSGRWKPVYDQGVILVWPNGQLDPKETAWKSHVVAEQEDVQLTRDLIDAVGERVNVDAKRVYAAGFSNGGHQTTMLACFAPELFAGFAVVSQTVHKHVADACEPTVHKPMLYLAGNKDKHWSGRDFSLSAMDSVAFWQQGLGCPAKPKKQDIPDNPKDNTSVQRWTYAPCDKVTGFEFLRVEGGEHKWPGTGPASEERCLDVDGSEEVVGFFKKYAGL
jgi:polyhydroxybutyrate depolymerase